MLYNQQKFPEDFKSSKVLANCIDFWNGSRINALDQWKQLNKKLKLLAKANEENHIIKKCNINNYT